MFTVQYQPTPHGIKGSLQMKKMEIVCFFTKLGEGGSKKGMSKRQGKRRQGQTKQYWRTGSRRQRGKLYIQLVVPQEQAEGPPRVRVKKVATEGGVGEDRERAREEKAPDGGEVDQGRSALPRQVPEPSPA